MQFCKGFRPKANRVGNCTHFDVLVDPASAFTIPQGGGFRLLLAPLSDPSAVAGDLACNRGRGSSE